MPAARLIRKLIVVTAAAFLAGCDRASPEAPGSPAPDQITIQPAGPTTLTSLGDTLRLTATVRDGEGNIIPDAPVSWASASPGVAFVTGAGGGTASAGTATGTAVLAEAISDGSSSISAASGQATGELLLDVRQAAASVTITPALPDTLFFRDTIRLTAAASDARGHRIADPELQWSISASPAGQSCCALEFVTQAYGGGGFSLTTTASGPFVLLYPINDGAARIVASAGTGTAGMTVNARQRIVAVAIEPNPIGPLDVGSNAELSVNSRDSHGSPGYVNQRAVTLTSSDPSIAEVVLGMNDADSPEFYVVPRAPGVAALTASLTTVDGTFTATAPVTVKAAP